jgi:Ras-related protein Rab-23
MIPIYLQVIVVGNGGVGKTSMIKRFCTGAFTGEYKKTIGVDFLQKKVFVPSQSETITMDLWDTAGQEEFDTLTRNYYRGAQACVIVFSTTDRASFVAVESWKEKVEREVQGLPILIVQNKVDQIESAVMTPKEAEDLSRKLGLKLYRTCVKDNTNVDAVFELLADLAMRPQAAAPVKEHASSASSSGGSAAAQPAAAAASSTASSNSGVVKPSKRSKFLNFRMYIYTLFCVGESLFVHFRIVVLSSVLTSISMLPHRAFRNRRQKGQAVRLAVRPAASAFMIVNSH